MEDPGQQDSTAIHSPEHCESCFRARIWVGLDADCCAFNTPLERGGRRRWARSGRISTLRSGARARSLHEPWGRGLERWLRFSASADAAPGRVGSWSGPRPGTADKALMKRGDLCFSVTCRDFAADVVWITPEFGGDESSAAVPTLKMGELPQLAGEVAADFANQGGAELVWKGPGLREGEIRRVAPAWCW